MAMNNNSFDPYAVGDGRAEDHGYMSVPVTDMDMNMPVEPPMEVEPEMPFDPVETEPVMESEPAVVPAPERRVVPVTHRVIGNLRRMRDVMHLDDRGVVADRSQPGKDNGATLVELKGGAVALVFDRQDVAWKSIAWSLFTAPERLEATGEILPAGEVPFTLPRGVKFCIVNPDEVRFYNRNSLGMIDRAVDILVGVGVFQQVTHRAPSRAARKQYRTAVKSHLRDLVLKSRKERKPMKRLKNMAAAIGRTPARMLNGMRRRSAGLGDLQQMIKGQDLLKDARSVAGQRRQMVGQNAPRMDVVEVDQALAYLQHTVLRLVRPMVDDSRHPLNQQAIDLMWSITDLVSDALETQRFAEELATRLSPLDLLSARAAVLAGPPAAESKPEAEAESGDAVDHVLTAIEARADGGTDAAGVTNQIELAG